MLPSPTLAPAADKTNPNLPENVLRLLCIIKTPFLNNLDYIIYERVCAILWKAFVKFSWYFWKKLFWIKKEALTDFVWKMVTRTGFEPVSACVKGMWVNRFSNAPCIWNSSFLTSAHLYYYMILINASIFLKYLTENFNSI